MKETLMKKGIYNIKGQVLLVKIEKKKKYKNKYIYFIAFTGQNKKNHYMTQLFMQLTNNHGTYIRW